MSSTQEEQNKQVVRQVFEFYNQQEIEKVEKLFSPKHVFHFPGAPPMDWNSHKQLEASSYYQLVLLDIRMPRLNGLQLFNTIKAMSPNAKIMFCSALDVAEELTNILPDIKYNHIIKKPVERIFRQQDKFNT
jgi:CheY-like chemotaxis protein